MRESNPESIKPDITAGCPQCGERLMRGVARVRSGVLTFLVYGFSWVKLFFTPDDPSSGEAEVLSSGERMLSFRCGKCGLVAITRTASPKV